MASKGAIVVTGIPEVTDALERVGNMSFEKAEHEAGKALLGDIRSKTRFATGAMQGGWNLDGGSFVNSVDYASKQEFGTQFVDPTFAVFRSWDEKQDAIEKAFAKEIDNAASQAGFDT
jgi:hypothetical protein